MKALSALTKDSSYTLFGETYKPGIGGKVLAVL